MSSEAINDILIRLNELHIENNQLKQQIKELEIKIKGYEMGITREFRISQSVFECSCCDHEEIELNEEGTKEGENDE